MRLGEILGLRWEQVDLKHGFILLDKTKNNERREIPIKSPLRATLEAIPHGPESEHVFTDRNGKPYKSVNNSFPTARKKAGIHDIHFHDLRHTFASHLAMAGVDIATVKELLGHKDITMTLRYAHLAPSHKAKAVRMLEKRLRFEDKNNDVLDKNYTVSGVKGRVKVVSPYRIISGRGDLNPRPRRPESVSNRVRLFLSFFK
jgi:integrase